MWLSSIRGALTLPRFSGGCTHVQCFFSCSSRPVQMTNSSGSATIAAAQ